MEGHRKWQGFYWGLLLSLVAFCLPRIALAKWYLLASVHPNNLVVIDTETDKITKNIQLEGRGPSMNIAPNPQNPQFAYVVNEMSQSVAMVDIDEGKQVATFPLSTSGELVRTMAIDVNAQGSRLLCTRCRSNVNQGSSLPSRTGFVLLTSKPTKPSV